MAAEPQPFEKRNGQSSLVGLLFDLSHPRIPLAEELAVALAWKSYGVDGNVRRLATEKDDTFIVKAPTGAQFILKVAHPLEPMAELELQISVLRHLEARSPGVPVPRVLPNVDGSFLTLVESEAGPPRMARLMTFLPGTVLDTTTATDDQRASIGEILAELRFAMADFGHPADGRIVAWDVTNLLSFAELAEHIVDLDHRRSVELALDSFAEIQPLLPGLRSQVLHNDFNTSNIVVDQRNPRFVNGIIDFGDTVRTAIAVDVSTALMNQMPNLAGLDRGDPPFEGAHALLKGYLRLADLTAEELRIIPYLAMGRVALRGLLTSWRAALFPENGAYILRNTQAGWFHLDWFLSMSRQQMDNLLTDRLEGVR